MGEAKTDQEVQSIRDDVDQLKQDLRSLLEGLGEEGRAKVHSLETRMYSEKDRAEQCIREHPMTSVVAALGVGVLIGGLLRR